MATILCTETTHLACMERTSYEKVLKFLEQKALNEVIEFFQSIPIFSTWTKRSLAKLKYYFVKKTYPRKGIVYKAGDPSTYVYIVKSGEFEVSCKVQSPFAKPVKVDYMSQIGPPTRKQTVNNIYRNLLAKRAVIKPTLMQNLHVY